MTPKELREQLLELKDSKYREFHLKTCPQANHVIGVRLPEQRKLAKAIIKTGNYFDFLESVRPHYYEEIMITGLVIATAPMEAHERLDYIAWFLPLIDNWAICDSFCNSFKIQDDADQTHLWVFLIGLTDSTDEYTLRFVFVMILCHFIHQDYLNRIFQLLDQIKSEKYYVEMAKAWLITEIFTKFPAAVFDYLLHDQLSTFAHNKAIQKACESRRISDKDKQKLRSLKL